MIVVTGGAGFIGSNLVAALEEETNEDIIVCDYIDSSDKWQNIKKKKRKEVISPDNLLQWLSDHISKVEIIFHLGAISSTTERNTEQIVSNNYCFSQNLWKICTNHNLRLIYASSAAVYGNGNAGFEDKVSLPYMEKLYPLNPYGWSKLLFDQKVAYYSEVKNFMPLQWAGLRFFNVYGPNEFHKKNQQSVIPQFWKQIKETGEAKLFKSYDPKYPDGGQMRDFIYIDDCINVMIWLYENINTSGIFNVGTGQARTFEDVAKAISDGQKTNTNIEYFHMPPNVKKHYQYFTQADIKNLRDAGYTKNFTSLEDGVNAYIENFLATNDPYR